MAELHRVTIDGVEYNLPSGGGGGSSVIPNPEGTPTAKLEKLQIEDTIFNIESGITDVDWRDISGKPEFANVATSGSYNDLSHKPTIPSMEMVDSKVDKEDGKTLSSNDFTNEYKSAIDNLPTSYAPVNAQANVIETIKVNGKALTPADKAVSITVPAAVTETTVSGWGFTKNAGTITEVKMNGNSMGSSGVIDLGSVITSLPDISHKVDDTRKVNGKALSSDVTLSANDILTDDNMSIQKRLDELESFESITYKGTVASFDELPTNAANGDMYYCTADKLHYVCVNDPLINFYEWHEYHTFDDDYIITVEKVANNLTTVSEGYVLDARQGKQLKDAIDNIPSMDNIVLHKDPIGEPVDETPRDADTLGGKSSEYYAKSSDLTFDGNYKFRVGLDGDGNPGFYKADGSLSPFKSKFEDMLDLLWTNPNPNSAQTGTPYTINIDSSGYRYLMTETKRQYSDSNDEEKFIVRQVVDTQNPSFDNAIRLCFSEMNTGYNRRFTFTRTSWQCNTAYSSSVCILLRVYGFN